jgi:hypothetical protein
LQRPLPDSTQHSQETDIHAPCGIRTHDPSKQAAEDLRLRSHGHWDRHIQSIGTNKYRGPTSASQKIIVFILIEPHPLFGRIRLYSRELNQERGFKYLNNLLYPKTKCVYDDFIKCALIGTIGPIDKLCVGIEKSLAPPLQKPKIFIYKW